MKSVHFNSIYIALSLLLLALLFSPCTSDDILNSAKNEASSWGQWMHSKVKVGMEQQHENVKVAARQMMDVAGDVANAASDMMSGEEEDEFPEDPDEAKEALTDTAGQNNDIGKKPTDDASLNKGDKKDKVAKDQAPKDDGKKPKEDASLNKGDKKDHKKVLKGGHKKDHKEAKGDKKDKEANDQAHKDKIAAKLKEKEEKRKAKEAKDAAKKKAKKEEEESKEKAKEAKDAAKKKAKETKEHAKKEKSRKNVH